MCQCVYGLCALWMGCWGPQFSDSFRWGMAFGTATHNLDLRNGAVAVQAVEVAVENA